MGGTGKALETCAVGNTGSGLVTMLLEKGSDVPAFVPDKSKAGSLKEAGREGKEYRRTGPQAINFHDVAELKGEPARSIDDFGRGFAGTFEAESAQF